MLSFQPTQFSFLNGKVILKYKIKGSLGEGGFGKVKLAEDPETGVHIAIKIIPRCSLEKKKETNSACAESQGAKNRQGPLEVSNAHHPQVKCEKPKFKGDPEDMPVRNCKLVSFLAKEVAIHKAIKHPNIIELIEYCGNSTFIFLMMEWAAAGELFDKIVPDVGLAEDVSHFFFRQLTSAVAYLHKNGIAHRDLKPENMLLDASGNLKLTDFGLATIFKYKDKTRMLNSACGSPVYMAPEVLQGPYHGDAADLWSMGVILFVMFKGVAPWTEPTTKCYDFGDYLFSRYDGGPLPKHWKNIPRKLRDLLFGLISVSNLRMTMADVKSDPWFTKKNPLLGEDGMCVNVLLLAQKMCDYDERTTMSTQPEFHSWISSNGNDGKNISSFSQPTITHIHQNFQDKTCATQLFSGEPLTRFFTLTPPDILSISLSQRFADLHINYSTSKRTDRLHFYFDLIDSKRCPIQGHVHVQKVSKDIWLAVFIRKKGDPLEFKKVFQKTLEGCTWNVFTRFAPFTH